MDLTYKNKLTKLAEETQRKQEEESRKYNYIDQAMFKIKDRDYISPYDRVGLNDYSAKTQEEINNIYKTLSPYYKNLADIGNPNDDEKYQLASVMYANVMDTSYQDAREKVDLYYPIYADRDFREKGFTTRLWDSIKTSYYNDQLGYATSLYVTTKNDMWKKRADDLYEKMMKVRNWQDYGMVGNFFLDNMQGIYSMGKMALITALTSGIGTALGASSGLVHLLSSASVTLDSGASQHGINTYMMAKTTDDNGNPLFDFDNITPKEQAVFFGGLLSMGLIETLEMETLGSILPKAIRSSIATSTAKKATQNAILKTFNQQGIKLTLGAFAKKIGKNITGEGFEEVLQQMVGNAIESYQADLKNSQGANFKGYDFKEHLTEGAWQSFIGGLKGSILASILSVGGATYLNGKTAKRIQSDLARVQQKTDTSNTIYKDFVDTSNSSDITQSEIQRRAEEIKGRRVEPINLYQKEKHIGFFTDREGALTLKALEYNNGNLQAIEGEVINDKLYNLEDKRSKTAFATKLNGKLSTDEENTINFTTQERLNDTLDYIRENYKDFKETQLDNGKVQLAINTTNGEQIFTLQVQDNSQNATSGDLRGQIREFVDKTYKVYNQQERTALSEFYNSIYNITKKGKNSSIDNFLSSINIVFDEKLRKANIDIDTAPSESGYKKATIHLTPNSTFESITHELNHYIQNNASIDDLKGFETAYKINLNEDGIWQRQISKEIREERGIKNKNYTYAELFANDATKYYQTGKAKNSQMRSLFEKMARVLQTIKNFFYNKLNKETLGAFDKLFSNEKAQRFYETYEDNELYDFNDKKTREELKEKGYIIPPLIAENTQDAELINTYNEIEEYNTLNNTNIIQKARDIKESIELDNKDTQTEIYNEQTSDEEKQIKGRENTQEESNIEDESIDKQARDLFFQEYKGKLTDNAINLAWKLSQVKTQRELNLEFIRDYTLSKEDFFKLIDTLNRARFRFDDKTITESFINYTDTDADILNLTRNSKQGEINEALTTIRNNPTSYRMALEDATDFLQGEDAIAKREYQREYNEDILEYLGKIENQNLEEQAEAHFKRVSSELANRIIDKDTIDLLKENTTNIRDLANRRETDEKERQELLRTEERLREIAKELQEDKKTTKKENETLQKEKEKLQKEKERLEKQRDNLKARFENYREKTILNRELKKSIQQLKKQVVFNKSTLSGKFADGLYWVKLKVLDQKGTATYFNDLNKLESINRVLGIKTDLNSPNALLGYLLDAYNVDIDNLQTLNDFKNLNKVLNDYRKLARKELENSTNRRRESLFNERLSDFNAKYGTKGTYLKGKDLDLSFYDLDSVGTLNAEIQRISNEQKEKNKNKKYSLARLFTATAHAPQIARFIDKTLNGSYQKLTDTQKLAENNMIKSTNKRYKRIQSAIENLGFDTEKLTRYLIEKKNESGKEFIVKSNQGFIHHLNRNQALMIYAYSLQEQGLDKLTHKLGNNFSQESINNLVDNLLSVKDKNLAELFSQELSSKYNEIADIYLEQNNDFFPYLENYFPLYAESGSMKGNQVNTSQDDLNLLNTNKTKVVNKSFTKKRTNTTYALKLDLMNNFLSAIDSQERYIHLGTWVRDAQYWLSDRGMGKILSATKGSIYRTTLKEWVDDIANPRRQLNEVNGFMSGVFNNIQLSNLMFNTVSAIKQVGGWMAIFSDPDFNIFSSLKAIHSLMFNRSQTIQAIEDANPSIEKQRAVGFENIERLPENNLKYFLGKGKEWGLFMADKMDLQGRYLVWQSAYQSYLDKHGISDGNIQKAIVKANKIIDETQNNNLVSSLSAWQRKTSLFGKEKLAYTNSTFQYLNKLYDAIFLFKNKQNKQALGNLTMLIMNAGFMTLLGGAIFKRAKSEDDKEEKKKEIAWQMLDDLISNTIPLADNVVPAIRKQRTYSTSLYDFTSSFRSVKDLLENLARMTVAYPKIEVDRLVKGFTTDADTTQDRLWAILLNVLLGTKFYKNVKDDE